MTCSENQIAVADKGNWLIFDAPVTGVVASASGSVEWLWELLRLNAVLPAPIKLALPPWQTGLRLRAEIPRPSAEDHERRSHEVCKQIEVLIGTVAPDCGKSDGSPAPSEPHADLPSLCGEAGWEFVQRGDGSLAVALEVPGAFCQALMQIDPAHHVRLWVDLNPDLLEASAVCRRAVAALLLRSCALIRFARAAAIDWAPRYEVILGPVPSAVEIDEALSSLAIACRLCVREVELLGGDDALAQAFLQHVAADDSAGAEPNIDVKQPEPAAPQQRRTNHGRSSSDSNNGPQPARQ